MRFKETLRGKQQVFSFAAKTKRPTTEAYRIYPLFIHNGSRGRSHRRHGRQGKC